jgi:hypothetical protein
MTTPRAYLIVAVYNLANYRSLDAAQHQQARTVALKLFPAAAYGGASSPVATLAAKGVLKASSFASDLFSRLPGDYDMASATDQRAAIEAAYALGPLQTPIGWMAVVQEDRFLEYAAAMGSEGTAFVRMYDIDVRSLAAGWTPHEVAQRTPALRNDKSTDDIYWFMTPTNWRS